MDADETPSKASVLTLAIIFLASLIDGLDASIVTVSLPTMAIDLDVSVSQSSWVMFSYVVGMAAFLLPMGKMAKNNRVRKFMITGTVIFGLSSFMCGVSKEIDNFWILIAFRTIQGLSAAMMSSVLPSMVVHMLPEDRKGLGMSVMGASTALALILGPVVGGAISSFLDWSWLFYINVPICVVIVILSMIHIPDDGRPDREKDPTFVGGLSAMMVIGSLLVIMEDLGDPDINLRGRIICAVLAALGVYLLVWSIRRDAKRAIVSPKMLNNREYIVVGIAFLLCTIVVAGCQFLLPYMLQDYWDLSTFDSGLYLSAVSVAMMLVVIPVGRMCDRFGCKWPAAMAAILRAAFCMIMIVLATHHSEPLMLIPALLVFGASHAFSGTAQPTRMIHHATPGYEDEATNFMLVVNYVASALGCVIFAMLFSVFSKTANMNGLSHNELLDGFLPAMWFSVAILMIALMCTLSVKNKIVRKK